mmetsp:Transcript_31699/g.58414  ORF Transcript_31699/g.58414 Transcript_31699/m.58414 type:complete len:217 (-) Transcript_31699:1013-1663(-)
MFIGIRTHSGRFPSIGISVSNRRRNAITSTGTGTSTSTGPSTSDRSTCVNARGRKSTVFSAHHRRNPISFNASSRTSSGTRSRTPSSGNNCGNMRAGISACRSKPTSITARDRTLFSVLTCSGEPTSVSDCNGQPTSAGDLGRKPTSIGDCSRETASTSNDGRQPSHFRDRSREPSCVDATCRRTPTGIGSCHAGASSDAHCESTVNASSREDIRR